MSNQHSDDIKLHPVDFAFAEQCVISFLFLSTDPKYSQGEEQLPIKPPQPRDSIARYHPLRKHRALFLAPFFALVPLSELANNTTFIMHSTTLISFIALLLFAAVTFANPVAAPRPLERKALKQFQYKRGATPVRRSPQFGRPSK